MTWWEVLSGGIVLLFGLLLLGVPIFVAFLILNVTGILVLLGPSGFGMFANSIFTTGTLNALAAVPLFILMGDILFRSGAIEVLLASMDRLVGRIRGRQYVLCILLSAVLGALSGAAMAVAGLLGRSLFPTMLKRGYDRHLSAGTILAGASLDPIIPPSVLAILIATIAQISTGKLLLAGIIPGILLTGMFLVYVFIRLKINPALAPDVDADDPAKARDSIPVAILKMIPSLFIFFLVMGLVMLGIATPTEAAATGVVGAVVLAIGYRKFSWALLREAFTSAASITSLLLLVMCCAVIFSQLLTLTGAATKLAELVVEMKLSHWMMLAVLLALPFLLELLCLDSTALMFILIPIYQPILKVYGFDEIWFYTLFLVVVTVGGITPPFGYTLFALKTAAPDVPMTDIFKASWPFTWIILLGLVIMAVFPAIITFLPNLTPTR